VRLLIVETFSNNHNEISRGRKDLRPDRQAGCFKTRNCFTGCFIRLRQDTLQLGAERNAKRDCGHFILRGVQAVFLNFSPEACPAQPKRPGRRKPVARMPFQDRSYFLSFFAFRG
jgi:hypothetical protein